ncbi:hypothetical protein SASPL_127513 [Salvia splendens]|uniref:Heparanase 1 n=1 Tax=Salvia splendens TaxID=180675 RepID=A0A8X8XC88_SALSN|nr:hypothetical protein SASPL_127513 [Salvia splendens]
MAYSDTLLSEMAFAMKILGLTLWWLYITSQGATRAVSQSANGTVHIDGSSPIGVTDEDFICATMDWWPPTKCDYGTCSWGTASLLNLFIKNSSEMFGFGPGCLALSRWDELNTFFGKAGAKIIFGLNALTGRTIGPGGVCTGAWDPTNAESLMRHTVNSGYTIHGWELGNELSGNGIGASVAAEQYSADVITLGKKVQEIYKGFDTKPLVLGPGGFFDGTWFARFVKGAAGSLQVVTHHIYNLGPGVDEHLIEKILDPSYLDGEAQTFKDLQSIVKSSGSGAVAWVGEAGGAYNSGRNLVTNAFVFSFWYLDQLGMSAAYDSKTYCRQSFVGGNYGLIDTNTYVPNPDYYSALLWHRLMGRRVVSTSFNGASKMRAYAHCSKNRNGITLLLINLDNTTTVQVGVSVEKLTLEQAVRLTRKTQFSGGYREEEEETGNEMSRDEYHLTAKDGDLHSRTMLLNGEILQLNSSGQIPPLNPRRVDVLQPITVAPYSILFAQIPISLPACK